MQPAGQDLAPSRFFFAVLGPLARAADVPRPLLGRLTRTFIWVPRAQYTSMTEGATFSTNAFRNDTAQCVREVEFWRTLKSPVFNQECCSIQFRVKDVIESRPEAQTVMEEFPEQSSGSNGVVERGIQVALSFRSLSLKPL